MAFLNFLASALPGMIPDFAGENPMGSVDDVGRGIDEAFAANKAAQAPPKSRYGHGLGHIAGLLGDSLAQWAGYPANYSKNLAQAKRSEAMSNFLTDPDAAIAALLQGGDSEFGLELWKATHQKPNEPPSFVQEYQYRKGLSPEERAEYDKYAETRKFNPFGAPVVLQPGDVYEPGGSEGEATATGPNGEKVRFNPQSGQWEPMGGPTAPPSAPFP